MTHDNIIPMSARAGLARKLRDEAEALRLRHIETLEQAETTVAENAEALSWSMLFAAAFLGIVVGVLLVCIPATIVAVVEFGAFPW